MGKGSKSFEPAAKLITDIIHSALIQPAQLAAFMPDEREGGFRIVSVSSVLSQGAPIAMHCTFEVDIVREDRRETIRIEVTGQRP